MDSLLRYIRYTKVVPMVMGCLGKDKEGYYYKFDYFLYNINNPAYDKYMHDLTGIEELYVIFNDRRYKNIWREDLGKYVYIYN